MIRELAYDFLTNQGNRGWDLFHFQDYLPEQMIRHFQYALKSPDMRGVIAEAEFVKRYKDQWKFAPYKPTFNTVDAVVQCCGHVLMVMRGEQPGAGNFALPGGFIGQNEPLLDACIRELFEETQISVPRPVVLGSLHRREARVFDDPHRSSRGRTITHAYRFDLADKELPRVRGGDDAAAAMWIPINAVKPEKTFEDHAFIIRAMLGVS
jgi:bifunctional NMN adenylyltransferase/nudix hydrolase